MKKLIISAISAAALLFGFASCSGDLHDMNDAPIVEVPTKIVGAVNYDGGNVFSDMVKVDELTSTYTFIYSAGMSAYWDSPSDGVAFKVGYTKDGWSTCWGPETAVNTTLADGKGEVICKAQNAANIAFAGLTDGKTYKITAKAGIASVTVSIETAADIPSYILNANGILLPMNYTADGEKGVYKATVTPTSDTVELKFFDGTDNYGSESKSIVVSGSDTDKDGNAEPSSPAVVEKLSNTVTGGVKITGLKKNPDGKYFQYVATLTIDGDSKTVTVTRIIPQHKVTYNFKVSGGITTGDIIFIHGWNTLGSYGFEWPCDKNIFDNSKKTWSAVVDEDGVANIKGSILLLDSRTYKEEGCFCIGVVGADKKLKWQTTDCKLPEYKTSEADLDLYFDVVLEKVDSVDKGTGTVTVGKAPAKE